MFKLVILGLTFSLNAQAIVCRNMHNPLASRAQTISINFATGELQGTHPFEKNVETSASLFNSPHVTDMGGLQTVRWVSKVKGVLADFKFYQAVVSEGKVESLQVSEGRMSDSLELNKQRVMKFLDPRRETEVVEAQNKLTYLFEFSYDQKGRPDKMEMLGPNIGWAFSANGEGLVLRDEINVIKNGRGEVRGLLFENHFRNSEYSSMGAFVTTLKQQRKENPVKQDELRELRAAQRTLLDLRQILQEARVRAKNQEMRIFELVDFQGPPGSFLQYVSFVTKGHSGVSQLQSRLGHDYAVTQFFDRGVDSEGRRLIELRPFIHQQMIKVGKRERGLVPRVLVYRILPSGEAHLEGLAILNGTKLSALERDPEIIKKYMLEFSTGWASEPIISNRRMWPVSSLNYSFVGTTLKRMIELQVVGQRPSSSNISIPIFEISTGKDDREVPVRIPMTPEQWPFPVADRPKSGE